MKHRTKLSQEQQHAETQQSQQHTGQEFASAEEMLRFDAAQTSVPPGIAERLKQTIREVKPPQRPGWLKRFFGGTSL